jgi:PucR family transcriptional regulator, purine catabolism regulatory protein
MRVRELLEMTLLQDAGLRVVAGEDRLDQDIRWVHSSELGDVAQYLSGGEALLTAATGVSSPADSRRYIRELQNAGVTCVILELVRQFNTVPQEMLDQATKGTLVLATLEREVPFVRVTEQAHTMLVSSAHATLQRALEIDDALTALMREGAALGAVLELLAERLDNPVILEDGSRRAIAHGGAPASIAPLLRRWQTHSRQGHRLDHSSSVQHAREPDNCAWSAITVRGEDWGRLHVVEVDSPIDDLARLTLGRAAPSIALYLMGEREAALSEAAEHSLVGGLVAADRFSGRDFLARASGLGVELSGELAMLIIGSDDSAETLDGDQLTRVVADTRKALQASRWPGVVGVLGGYVAVVATADPPRGLEEAAVALASAVSVRPLDHVQIGVSRPCLAARLPQAHVEASAAQRLGPLSGKGPAHFYDALVLYRLLSHLSGGPSLANFVEEELGALLSPGDQASADLLRTLDAYLQANGNKIATAQRLHLQRRSVYYRLERIEALLGRSLDDPEQRVRSYIALRGYEMLQARLDLPDAVTRAR